MALNEENTTKVRILVRADNIINENTKDDWGFPPVSGVKNLSAMQETWV